MEPEILDEVFTRRLSIVDRNGQPRIELGFDANDQPELLILGPGGDARIRARVDAQGAFLQIGRPSDGAGETATIELVALESGHASVELTLGGFAHWGAHMSPGGVVRQTHKPS